MVRVPSGRRLSGILGSRNGAGSVGAPSPAKHLIHGRVEASHLRTVRTRHTGMSFVSP